MEAQKGTCGMIFSQEEMPYNRDGISPDLIVNPHAYPSRMTIGQLIECLMGKAAACLGARMDGTPFQNYNVDEIGNILQSVCGWERMGNEVLYHGHTGEQIDAMVFMGPTYYLSLKHMVQDKVHCLTPDHEVLTSTGWKPIASIQMEDKVATLQDNKLIYENPLNTLEFNHKGKIYHISNQAIDLDVTMEHRMYVSKPFGRKCTWKPYEFIKAQDIKGKYVKYKKDAEWVADKYQFVLPFHKDLANRKHPERVLDMDSWITFFGIWIAEGWTTSSSTQIAVNKDRVKNALFPALDKMNMNYKYNKEQERVYVYDIQLKTYMSKYSVYAPNKYLPEWCFQLNKEQSQLLIHSMILGDGYYFKRNGEPRAYYTSSKKLADDFQRLCLHAGWASMISLHIEANKNFVKINNRDVVNHHNIYRCSLIKKRTNPCVNHSHIKTQEIQDEKEYDYEGKVYCLQVPGEVFYVRKNGKSVWTGNSRSNGPSVLLTRQPTEGRSRDGGLRIGEMERDVILSHGIMQFLKERLFDCSDKYFVSVCKETGMIAAVNPEAGVYKSLYSEENSTDFVKVQLPYASKLFIQEMMGFGLAPRMKV
jgi:hypothetical protein